MLLAFHLSLDNEYICTVASHSLLASTHSTLSGTIGFITDLRMHAVIANVDSALRVSALFLQGRHHGMSGGGRAVLPRR